MGATKFNNDSLFIIIFCILVPWDSLWKRENSLLKWDHLYQSSIIHHPQSFNHHPSTSSALAFLAAARLEGWCWREALFCVFGIEESGEYSQIMGFEIKMSSM